jgi:hypothetical protein
MNDDALALLFIVLAFLGELVIVARWMRKIEARIEALEAMAHPPIDLRPHVGPLMRPAIRAEVERFLAEHVP